jgi:hypothetical protein
MKTKFNQDEIIDRMGADNINQVASEFAGKSVDEIEAELNKMYAQDDDNGELASAIYGEIN